MLKRSGSCSGVKFVFEDGDGGVRRPSLGLGVPALPALDLNITLMM